MLGVMLGVMLGEMLGERMKLGLAATIALSAGPAWGDEITTSNGDHLNGKIVEVGCSGAVVEYFGARLTLPLADVTHAVSVSPVAIRINGGDRLTGRIAIDAGKLSIVRNGVPLKLATACLPAKVPVARLAAIRGTGTKDEPAKDEPAKDAKPDAPASDTPPEIAPNNTEQHSLSFLRDQAVLVTPRKVQADVAFGYLRNQQSIINDKLLIFTPTLRVGLLPGLEGYVLLPYIWGQRQIVGIGSGVLSTEVAGIGDVRFGVKYNLLGETADHPNVVVGIDVSAPTGQSPYIAPLPFITALDIRNPLAVTLGRGHWGAGGSVFAIKSYDPVVVFSGLTYIHYFPETFFGVEVAPGDFIELTGGLGFAINENSTVSGQLFADYARSWSFNGTNIPASASQPISLRFAYTHILGAHDLVEPSILFGLTRDANSAALTLSYSHQF